MPQIKTKNNQYNIRNNVTYITFIQNWLTWPQYLEKRVTTTLHIQHYCKSCLPELKKSCFSVQHFHIYNNVTYLTFLQNLLTRPQFLKRVTSLLLCNILKKIAYLDPNKSFLSKDDCSIYNNITYITTCSSVFKNK